jgi:hypothetical protein
MTLTITLSEEQAVALQAKAAAEGLSLEEWRCVSRSLRHSEVEFSEYLRLSFGVC